VNGRRHVLFSTVPLITRHRQRRLHYDLQMPRMSVNTRIRAMQQQQQQLCAHLPRYSARRSHSSRVASRLISRHREAIVCRTGLPGQGRACTDRPGPARAGIIKPGCAVCAVVTELMCTARPASSIGHNLTSNFAD